MNDHPGPGAGSRSRSAGAELLADLGGDTVAPGLIQTAMTEAMPPEVFAEREAAIPMRRAGQPEEAARGRGV